MLSTRKADPLFIDDMVVVVSFSRNLQWNAEGWNQQRLLLGSSIEEVAHLCQPIGVDIILS